MSISPADVEHTVVTFLTRVDKLKPDFSADMPLHTSDGVGLDSLEAAELSAVLEDEHGHDPYSRGTMPESLNDILEYFGAVGAEA